MILISGRKAHLALYSSSLTPALRLESYDDFDLLSLSNEHEK